MTTVSTRKNAVILGATSGIGKNMALCLARQGWRVGVAGRRENLLAELRAEQPDSLVPQRIDIAEPESLRAGLEELAAALGRIDLAVICSGVGFLNPDLADDQERQTIAVNVAGFTLAADWIFRYIQQRGSGTRAAVTSVGGLLGEETAPA
ncbi:MAG: SDR family NAD(P)-dependent oxidoreductase, partial [Planctomycetes bacterium]|nr:SDR family NAD(P)-dependent oxidoreductase [Planctomycetota bacterium]